MEASKVVFDHSMGVDFRVKNTFIEWIPTLQPDHKTLKRSSSWHGLLMPTPSPPASKVIESPAVEIVGDKTGKSVRASTQMAKTLSRDHQAGLVSSKLQDQQNWSISKPYEHASIAKNEAIEQRQGHHRRPTKRTRLLCTRIVEHVIKFYSHDKVMMARVASALASQSSYMRGLCLKHRIPMTEPEAEVDNHVFYQNVPCVIQNWWAQAFGGQPS
eukprot:TRINITY_DN3285_c0_g2_i1.p1 TRINITY_DN3285_c0_g2~~TRINITY_DN3285_c0_g2_i1.p1  ORF type:complete len:215 (+),score=27.95 TRINITY_DN3285_c0_g2_i1:123-767(+)